MLLGDPQQLEQPKKGSHPDGVNVSALQHILGEHQTIPAERGIFLPVTWRLAPSICRVHIRVVLRTPTDIEAGPASAAAYWQSIQRERLVGR